MRGLGLQLGIQGASVSSAGGGGGGLPDWGGNFTMLVSTGAPSYWNLGAINFSYDLSTGVVTKDSDEIIITNGDGSVIVEPFSNVLVPDSKTLSSNSTPISVNTDFQAQHDVKDIVEVSENNFIVTYSRDSTDEPWAALYSKSGGVFTYEDELRLNIGEDATNALRVVKLRENYFLVHHVGAAGEDQRPYFVLCEVSGGSIVYHDKEQYTGISTYNVKRCNDIFMYDEETVLFLGVPTTSSSTIRALAIDIDYDTDTISVTSKGDFTSTRVVKKDPIIQEMSKGVYFYIATDTSAWDLNVIKFDGTTVTQGTGYDHTDFTYSETYYWGFSTLSPMYDGFTIGTFTNKPMMLLTDGTSSGTDTLDLTNFVDTAERYARGVADSDGSGISLLTSDIPNGYYLTSVNLS